MVPWLLAAGGLTALTYGALVAKAWRGYGRPRAPAIGEEDALLDDLIPVYDIVERHCIRVHASANVALRAASEVDLFASPVVRLIFKTRQVVLRAEPQEASAPSGLVELAKSLGWGVLSESPGREIVMGAVTQPWKPNVVFESLPAEAFQQFSTPDYVKIAWTLRADPAGAHNSMFRTETRALATDATARAKFRRYWALVSPGVWFIRRLTLRPIKRRAERQSVTAGV